MKKSCVKPIGGNSPDNCCTHCGISEFEINNRLEGHASHCEYRISKEKEKKTIEALANLLFAYANKDEDFPHAFEVKAVEEAVNILKTEYKGDRYSLAFFEGILKRIKELVE